MEKPNLARTVEECDNRRTTRSFPPSRPSTIRHHAEWPLNREHVDHHVLELVQDRLRRAGLISEVIVQEVRFGSAIPLSGPQRL